jgi:carboxylate-amine ligase
LKDRRIGLEQELFLVDEEGILSNRADEFLDRCHELAEAEGLDPGHFEPECTRSLVEVSTPPAESVEALADVYLASLRLALRAARDLGLRLYPLATYPLPVAPDMRDEPHYRIQAQTMGREKFLHAGRCAGVHQHLEVAPGTIDRRVGVSYGSSEAAREELLNVYNLVTALDPAIIALTRSSPFYEGELQDVTARTAYYRGSPDFAPSSLYANLVAVGGLRPYARGAEELVELQFERYREWLAAMEKAGVERQLFERTGDGLLEAAWNPVRLNPHGTVELRGIDGNYPAVVLDTTCLISGAVERVLDEGLTVKPTNEVGTLEVEDHFLRVPDLEYVGEKLFRAAAISGTASLEVGAYIDSIFEFVGEAAAPKLAFEKSTEDAVLEKLGDAEHLSRDVGLSIVREACDELEYQAQALYRSETIETTKAGTDGE